MIQIPYAAVLESLLLATRWTVGHSLLAFVGGALLGLVILFARMSNVRFLRVACRWFIEAFQGTPLLMQLFLVFFGLALLGYQLSSAMAASVALILWSAAFFAEIWRGCVQSIVKGQWDASSSLGMTYVEQMRHIILPQAARIAIAPTVGFLVQIVKETSLTSIIGFIELARAGSMLSNATYRPFEVYGTVAVIYFLLCWPLSKYSATLERKLNAAYRSS